MKRLMEFVLKIFYGFVVETVPTKHHACTVSDEDVTTCEVYPSH